MIGFLQGVIEFVVIPLIMLSGMVIAVVITRTASGAVERVGAYAGLLAGLVLGAGFAMAQLGDSSGGSGLSDGFTVSVWALLIGLVLGGGLPVVLGYVKEVSSLIGVITLLFSGASSLALFNYVMAGDTRDFIMLLAVSLLFGVLVTLTVKPDRYVLMKEALKPGPSRSVGGWGGAGGRAHGADAGAQGVPPYPGTYGQPPGGAP